MKPYRLPKRFDAVNEERHRLLDRKYSEGLSKAEAERLKVVSDEVSEMLRPFHEAGIKKLQQMKRQTDAAMRKLDKITTKYGLRSRRPGKPRRRTNACREYLDWLMTQPCVITGARSGEGLWELGSEDWLKNGPQQVWVDPAHVRTRRNNGDLWNAVSLAHHLHDDFHDHGRHTWCAKHGLTFEGLQELARQQTERFLESHPQFRPDSMGNSADLSC